MAKTKAYPLTAHQALYVLEKAIEDRKISAGDVQRYIAAMWEEMNFIERRLAELRDVSPVRAARAVQQKLSRGARRVGQRVSAQVAASRRLQGRYIAAIRQLPKNRRAKYAAIAKERGRDAAIAAIQKDSRG